MPEFAWRLGMLLNCFFFAQIVVAFNCSLRSAHKIRTGVGMCQKVRPLIIFY